MSTDPITTGTDAPVRPISVVPLRWTITLAGGGTLALEIIGSRYLTPMFGTSLFIWGAILAVTMLHLALGYAWGGRIAARSDARGSAIRLGSHVLIAAGWIALLPVFGAWLLMASRQLGAILGPLVVAEAALAVPITLLATAVPLAVSLWAAGSPAAAAGSALAWSTIGSVAGALGAAYVAVPMLGVRQSFLAVALLLALASLPLFFRALVSGRAALIAIGAVAAGYLLSGSQGYAAAYAPGMMPVLKETTRYTHLEVIDDTRNDIRILMQDGASQNAMHGPDWNESAFTYVDEVVAIVLRYWRSDHPRALILGLGAGALARELDSYGFQVDIVEIDPRVVEVARTYFGFEPEEHRVVVDDARVFVERAVTEPTRYDVIVVDVATGGTHPPHIYSANAFARMKQLLGSYGVLILNLVTDTVPPYDRVARHMAATVAPMFKYPMAIDLYPAGSGAEGGESFQMLVVASDRTPLRPLDFSRARPMRIDRSLRAFTDDWNPSDLWSAHANWRWRQNIAGWLGVAALIP